MRTMVRDALHDAERNHVAYYNLKRKDDKTIKNGSLVRLNLDHIDLHLFKRRGSKFNPLWFGPFPNDRPTIHCQLPTRYTGRQ